MNDTLAAQQAIIRLLASNPQPMSFATLAARVLEALAHEGFSVKKEMADAE